MLSRYSVSCTVVLLGSLAFAADEPKGVLVDSGSFGISVRGQRLATETFRMEQRRDANVASAQLQTVAEPKSVQSAEMEILSNGALKRYTWKETAPGKSQIVVEPQDNAFLVVKASESDVATAKDSTHPLSPFTSILDDNFFSQLQVLAWKYLAMGCRASKAGKIECTHTEQRLAIINPHQQQSQTVTMRSLGSQKLRLKSGESDCHILKLTAESGDWMMWLDEKNRLQKVVVPSENIEVVRD
jgi:hypothetical protein